MNYQEINNDKDNRKENIKNSFSKEFASKYDEIDKLTEQVYSSKNLL